MDQEFVTSAGKVIVSSKRLLVQDMKVNFAKTAIGEVTVPALLIACIVYSYVDPTKPFSWIAAVLFSGVFLFYYSKQLYRAVIRKSYSSYIPVSRITSLEVKPDESGLETEVRLHLKNGRYRSIAFRTLEKQYQPFTESVSMYIGQPQLV